MSQAIHRVVEHLLDRSHMSDGILMAIANIVADQGIDDQQWNIILLITCQRFGDLQDRSTIRTVHSNILIVPMIAMVQVEQSRVERTGWTFMGTS